MRTLLHESVCLLSFLLEMGPSSVLAGTSSERASSIIDPLVLAKSASAFCGSFVLLGTAVPCFFTAASSQEQVTRVTFFALAPILGLAGVSIWLFGARGFSRLPRRVQRVLAKCRPMSARPSPVSILAIRFAQMIKSSIFRAWL